MDDTDFYAGLQLSVLHEVPLHILFILAASSRQVETSASNFRTKQGLLEAFSPLRGPISAAADIPRNLLSWGALAGKKLSIWGPELALPVCYSAEYSVLIPSLLPLD